MKRFHYCLWLLLTACFSWPLSITGNVTTATVTSGGQTTSVDITHSMPSSPTTPPAAPGVLTGQMTGNNQVTLHWNPAQAADGRTITRYDIYLNGKKVGSTTATEYAAPFDSSPSALQFYSVVAIDDKGNSSVASGEVLVNPEAPAMLQVKKAYIYDSKVGVRGYASSARKFKHIIGTEYYKDDDINCGGPNANRFESTLRIEEAFAVDTGVSTPSTIDVSGTMTFLWPYYGYNKADNWVLHSSINYAVPTSNNITSHGSWPVGFYHTLPHALDSFTLGRKGGFQTETNWHKESIDSNPASCYSKVDIRDISLSEEDTNEDLLQRSTLHFTNVDAVLKLAEWNVYIPPGPTTSSVPPAQAYTPYAPSENIASRSDATMTSLGYTGINARSNQWGYYRWATNRAGMLHAQWLEVLDAGAGPVVVGEHDVSLFGDDSGAATDVFATLPTDVAQGSYGYGYRYICQVPTGIELQTSSVHPVVGQPRLYQRDALLIGEAVDLDIGASPTAEANRVISGAIQLTGYYNGYSVVADIGGDLGTLQLVAVDPAIVSAQGLKAAIAQGASVPSGTDIYPYLYPSYGSTAGVRNLVVVGLAQGRATITLHLQNYYYQFDVVKTIDVFSMSLVTIDANRDGAIKLASEDASDVTSAAKPYRFWLNDDIDRWHVTNNDLFQTANEQDDLETSDNGKVDWEDNIANSRRDLEDFTRLVIQTQGLTDAFKNGDLYLGLKWADVIGTPAIKLYKQYDATGGTSYLTDDYQASVQLPENAILNARYASEDPATSTHTLVEGSDVFVLPQGLWLGLSGDALKRSLLLEGCKAGKGQLKLVILKRENDNYTEIGEGPGVWMDLQPVRNFYQRWTVGDITSSGVQTANQPVYGYSPVPPSSTYSVVAGSPSFAAPVTEEEKDFVLFVHGWNMPLFEKDRFAETAFKRLWWQGYKGRFGFFRWPTFYTNSYIDPTDSIGPPLDPQNFDASEWNSWRSAAGLVQLLGDLKATYEDASGNSRVRVFAHSHGNLAVSEALRKAASPLVHTYVASQAAIAAHCFDRDPERIPDISVNWQNGKWYLELVDRLGLEPVSVTTPNVYAYYPGNAGLNQFEQYPTAGPTYMAGAQGGGKWVNYYNQSDWALDSWTTDQALKPDNHYAYSEHPGGLLPGDPDGWWFYNGGGLLYRLMLVPDDTYEIFAFAAQARSQPLGRQPGVMGLFNGLQVSWNVYGDKHPGHSAQFRSSISERWEYWNRLLVSFALKEEQ